MATQHDNTKDETPPNSVADAAELLRRFWSGQQLSRGLTGEADSRAILVAGQLLAIATQLARIADSLDEW